MLHHKSLSVVEARAALAAGLDLARAQSQPMAFAVVDRAGELIVCERMDGAAARVLKQAIRKAFTAAEMGRDTAVFGQQLRERGGDLVQWGDPRLTNLPGGMVVLLDGDVVGGVGCGGATATIDMAAAQAMVDAALSAAP